MDSKVIMVVDDHPNFQKLVTAFLVREGYVVRNALNAKEALAHLELEEPDLILLDIMMPDMDGIEFCKHIRNQYHRPILFITGTKQDEDKVKSLQVGGDDCIVKPFDPLDLVLRVKANLRWSALLEESDKTAQILNFPGLQINLERKTVMLRQQPVDLLAKELQLLIAFAKQPNQVFDPEQLYRLVWKDEINYAKETVKVHIHNLRKKIESNPGKPVYIITVNRLGYKFNPYGAATS
ncbi:response regulator transcription factor [Paenibacillus radicis (ex Gao et al. 2016)]|uniref:DNA-binding response regulator n=1 Tax=Paenibacillus radicis (ex Gao et al. 2016) TaxID=1737354 RepID=A0A917GYE2_9BACL|nr:response regulator transcription factor [Paenibacillus radicis (ex Gao et al. 2016)]GGG60390.1 DNA-binding response regulator [Paenibacillus radicis (ex Gao et al. 2016)]